MLGYASRVQSSHEEYVNCAGNFCGKLMILFIIHRFQYSSLSSEIGVGVLNIVRVPMNAWDVDSFRSELWGRDPDKFCGKNQISLR